MAKRFNESWDFASGEIEQARGMTSESAIADAIMRTVETIEQEKDPSKTYWVELGWDDKNTYACAMAYDTEDGYYGDDEEESYSYVLGKIAFCPDNSAMNEYEMDWMMPYDEETGEVWDTETSITTWDSAYWLAEEWIAIMNRINKSAGYEQLVDDDDWDDFDDEDSDLYEGCGSKKKKKKVLNQKKVCGEDAKRTKDGYTFYIDDNAEPEIVKKGLVDYTLDGFIDKGDYDAPCKIGFYDGDDEPAYIFVSGGVTDDGYEFEKETIEL